MMWIKYPFLLLKRWITVSGATGIRCMEILSSMVSTWRMDGKYHPMECTDKHGISRDLEWSKCLFAFGSVWTNFNILKYSCCFHNVNNKVVLYHRKLCVTFRNWLFIQDCRAPCLVFISLKVLHRVLLISD